MIRAKHISALGADPTAPLTVLNHLHPLPPCLPHGAFLPTTSTTCHQPRSFNYKQLHLNVGYLRSAWCRTSSLCNIPLAPIRRACSVSPQRRSSTRAPAFLVLQPAAIVQHTPCYLARNTSAEPTPNVSCPPAARRPQHILTACMGPNTRFPCFQLLAHNLAHYGVLGAELADPVAQGFHLAVAEPLQVVIAV